jgi:hypothetical protein
MRTLLVTLFIVGLFLAGQVWAQAPQILVAQTGWPHPHQITLLSEPCGWPGGAMRAQRILPGRTIVWGCWGYNPTGVQIQWQDDTHQWIHYFELWFWDDAGRMQQLGYQTLHLRLWLLRNGQ